MSRATIYRKIHEYGIVTPASWPAASADRASWPLRWPGAPALSHHPAAPLL